jgi:lipocalin
MRDHKKQDYNITGFVWLFFKTEIMRISFMFILTGLLLSHISCQTFKNSKTMDKSTVKELDINKYMGKWYEIARLPNSFEKNLVGVTADYSHLKEGRFNVVNKGYKANLNGKLKTAKGKAKIPDLNEKYHSFYFFILTIIYWSWMLMIINGQ